MARLMSVALTAEQVRRREKTVTRRLGWRELEPGDRLTLCAKVQGRRKGEPLVRLAEVEVVSVSRERLRVMGVGETAREGLPEMSSEEFVAFFCEHMRCTPETEVTRIFLRYLDDERGVR